MGRMLKNIKIMEKDMRLLNNFTIINNLTRISREMEGYRSTIKRGGARMPNIMVVKRRTNTPSMGL